MWWIGRAHSLPHLQCALVVWDPPKPVTVSWGSRWIGARVRLYFARSLVGPLAPGTTGTCFVGKINMRPTDTWALFTVEWLDRGMILNWVGKVSRGLRLSCSISFGKCDQLICQCSELCQRKGGLRCEHRGYCMRQWIKKIVAHKFIPNDNFTCSLLHEA